jgi:hypothetical protein
MSRELSDDGDAEGEEGGRDEDATAAVEVSDDGTDDCEAKETEEDDEEEEEKEEDDDGCAK